VAIFKYECPGCATLVPILNRVSEKQRRCPQCGNPIGIDDIDRQIAAAEGIRRKTAKKKRIAKSIAFAWLFFCTIFALWAISRMR